MDRFSAVDIDLHTWHLTLSVLIQQDSKCKDQLEEIQGKLLKGVSDSGLIDKKSIYRCDPETFHFSILDFVAMSGISRSDFEHMTEKAQEDIFAAVWKDLEIFKNWKFIKPRIFPGLEHAGQSIAVNLSISDKDDKIQFWDSISNIAALADLNIQIKFPPAIINLVRFFREPSPKEKEILSSNINQASDLVNKLSFKMIELSLVVSNNYLTNKNPVMYRFPLK